MTGARSARASLFAFVLMLGLAALALGVDGPMAIVRDQVIAVATRPADVGDGPRRQPSYKPPPLPPSIIVKGPTSSPALIIIPAINVHRPVETVGVDWSGTMNLPTNLWNAGWFGDGPVPGAPGDAIIEGHAGYPDEPLLFGRLNKLRPGDQIVVVLADGSRQVFAVESTTAWPAGEAPDSLGSTYGDPRLTLITCSGYFNDHYKSYSDRLVVEATFSGAA